MWKRAAHKIVFLVLVYILFALLTDPILRWGAVRVGQQVFGAKVEIAKLETDLFPPRVEVSGVAVADATQPMSNLFEFERTAFNLEGTPLLQKKFIVGEASLTGLKLGSPRQTSGALRVEPEGAPPGPSMTEKYAAASKDFSLEKVGEAKAGLKESYEVKPEDLESLKLANQLQSDYDNKLADWDNKWKAADFDGRAAKIRARFEAAEKESDLKKVKEYQAVAKDAKELAKEAKDFEAAFKADMAKAKSDLQAVQDARKRDTALVMSKLKLPSLDAESISKFLLGPELSAKLEKALSWIRWARAKLPASKQKPPPPVRGEGRTVTFPVEKAYPQWAIRTLRLSGEFPIEGGPGLPLEGVATGITAEQALLGQPTELHLGSKDGVAGRKFKLDAVLDHRGETAVDRIAMDYSGIPVGARTLGAADSIAVQVSPGVGSFTADVTARGEALDGRLTFGQRGVTLTPSIGPKGGGDLGKRVAATAFSGVDRVEAVVKVKGTLSSPDFGVSSSLGSAFADGIKKALGGEIEAKRKEIEAKIGGMVDAKTGAVEKQVAQRQNDLLAKLGKNGQFADEIETKVKDAIEKAQKSVLPTKSKDLKKIFK